MLPDDWLKQLRDAYPKRDGGGDSPRAITRLVGQAIANGATWEQILKGAQNYAIYCQRKGQVGTEFVQMLQTFVGRDWHFERWATEDMRTPAEKAQERLLAGLKERAAKVGFRDPRPHEPPAA